MFSIISDKDGKRIVNAGELRELKAKGDVKIVDKCDRISLAAARKELAKK